MTAQSLSSYIQPYLDNKTPTIINGQDKATLVIPEHEVSSANFICNLCRFIEELSLSIFSHGDYLLDGAIVTNRFIKQSKRILDALKNDGYKDVFCFDKGMSLIVKGMNGTNFIYQDKKFTKSHETLYTNFIRMKTLDLPIHDFNPYIDLVSKAIQRLFIGCQSLLKGKDRLIHIIQNMILHFEKDQDFPYQLDDIGSLYTTNLEEALLYLLKEEAENAQFQLRLKVFNKLPEKNYNSLKRYIDTLFNRYARLLVIRIDLGYAAKHRNFMDESQRIDEYQQARNDRARLYNNSKKNSLFDNLVGYVWKLEYGLTKGFHYHLILFFDGSKVCQDVYIAKQVGEYWNKLIPNDQGRYWNCNANKTDYQKLGIGMINHFDLDLRENLLDYVSRYLIKTDLFSRVIVRGNNRTGRTFGKGIVKDKKNGIGRPRGDKVNQFEGLECADNLDLELIV